MTLEQLQKKLEELQEKIDKYKKVKSFIKDNTEHALSRKKELDSKIEIIENLLKKF